MSRKRICLLSDLHAGSMYFDLPAFREAVARMLAATMRACHELHILGDVVEGKLNHKGQGYESFPLEMQEEIGYKAVSHAVKMLGPERIIVLPGNHDRKWGINLLDRIVERLAETFPWKRIDYYRDEHYYFDEEARLLGLHGIDRTGGSDYLGLTPLIMNNIMEIEEAEKARYIVLGHYHRPVVVQYRKKLILTTGSFQHGARPLRNYRTMYVLEAGENATVHFVDPQPTPRRELVEFWKRVAAGEEKIEW